MNEDEIKAFDKMVMNIAKHDNRKLIETEPNSYTAMIPLGDVFAEIRRFTNFIKAQQKKPS